MYENISEEQLIKAISAPQYVHVEALKAELTRRVLVSNKLLNESIIKLDGATRRYSKILIFLTAILAVLALVQICYLIWGNN
jgi:hypothetical protein